MLVLSRKPGQAIVLPGLGITIQVTEVQGNNVRIGITADPKYQIVRRELLEDEHAIAKFTPRQHRRSRLVS